MKIKIIKTLKILLKHLKLKKDKKIILKIIQFIKEMNILLGKRFKGDLDD
jgi:hypothetical protein